MLRNREQPPPCMLSSCGCTRIAATTSSRPPLRTSESMRSAPSSPSVQNASIMAARPSGPIHAARIRRQVHANRAQSRSARQEKGPGSSSSGMLAMPGTFDAGCAPVLVCLIRVRRVCVYTCPPSCAARSAWRRAARCWRAVRSIFAEHYIMCRFTSSFLLPVGSPPVQHAVIRYEYTIARILLDVIAMIGHSLG